MAKHRRSGTRGTHTLSQEAPPSPLQTAFSAGCPPVQKDKLAEISASLAAYLCNQGIAEPRLIPPDEQLAYVLSVREVCYAASSRNRQLAAEKLAGLLNNFKAQAYGFKSQQTPPMTFSLLHIMQNPFAPPPHNEQVLAISSPREEHTRTYPAMKLRDYARIGLEQCCDERRIEIDSHEIKGPFIPLVNVGGNFIEPDLRRRISAGLDTMVGLVTLEPYEIIHSSQATSF